MRQIKLAIRQFLGAAYRIVSYRIVAQFLCDIWAAFNKPYGDYKEMDIEQICCVETTPQYEWMANWTLFAWLLSGEKCF